LVSAIDVFGYIPTFRKSYKDPWSETLATWVLFAMADIFSILALSKYNFLTVTYLATITVVNISFFIFCTSRRRFSKKIDKSQAIKIAKDFLKTEPEKEDWFLKVKPSVKAFVLYGSMAKGINKPDSDIDIMVILPLEQEEKYTKGEYFYDYKGFKINIVLRSIEKLRKIAEEKKDLFQKEIFRKSEVLMDSDGEASNLLKEIDKI
jgi:predicted nucleotidyltransferase